MAISDIQGLKLIASKVPKLWFYAKYTNCAKTYSGPSLSDVSLLVFCTGNPWVFSAVPISVPIPAETHTCTCGVGFLVGQIFLTHTRGGYLQVCTHLQQSI
jgi:hypothetical protein